MESHGRGSGGDGTVGGQGAVLHYFLEASLQTGQWEASLNALAQHPHDARHMFIASKTLLRAGQWRKCVGLLQAATAEGQQHRDALDGERGRGARHNVAVLRLAELAAQACAQGGPWELAVQLCGMMRALQRDDVNQPRTAIAVSHVLSVVPRHATDTRRSLHAFADRLRADHSNHRPVWRHHQRQGAAHDGDTIQSNMQLTELMRRASGGGRARNAWLDGTHLFQNMQQPNAVTINILAKLLGRQHREAELLACMLSPTAPSPSETTGKALAEAAYDCRSWRAGLLVLSHAAMQQAPLLSGLAPLSASAAIPALMALRRNKGKWAHALAWWEQQPPRGTLHSLRGNQKVSSYVAHHVACSVHPHMAVPPLCMQTSTHAVPHLSWVWQRALGIIASTADVHPPRAALFGLQALHLACCWVKAVELYQGHQQHLAEVGLQELQSMQDIVGGDAARNWIPGDVVLKLRRSMWRG